MMSKIGLLVSVIGLGICFSQGASAVAQMPHSEMPSAVHEQTGQFRRIEQPFWLKATVTASGLGLIGLELWWFLLSQPRLRNRTTAGEYQETQAAVPPQSTHPVTPNRS